MIAFICLFFPAVICTYLVEFVTNRSFSAKNFFGLLISNAFLINMFIFAIKFFLNTVKYPLWQSGSDMTPDIALKFMVMAIVVILGILPVETYFFKQKEQSVPRHKLIVAKECMREKRYNLIRAIATIMIVIWHWNTTCIEKNVELKMVHLSNPTGTISTGTVGVVLFFILSGTLLQRKCKDDFSTSEFWKKRARKILLPQIISYVTFFAICVGVLRKNFQDISLVGVLVSVLGLEFFGDQLLYKFGMQTVWLTGEWFTGVILLIYLIFPLLRWMYRKSYRLSSLIITVLFLVNLKLQILSNCDGWYSVSNGIFCVWCGMLIEKYKGTFASLKSRMLSFVICVALLVYNPTEIAGIVQLPSICFGLAFFIFLFTIDMSNKFFDYVSKYSFEIYLIHHRIFILLIPLFVFSEDSLVVQNFMLLFICTIVFMFAEKLFVIEIQCLKLVEKTKCLLHSDKRKT